ncbi:hypothetical protein ACIQI8_18925 [Streptomyces sp. NPDC092369]
MENSSLVRLFCGVVLVLVVWVWWWRVVQAVQKTREEWTGGGAIGSPARQ